MEEAGRLRPARVRVARRLERGWSNSGVSRTVCGSELATLERRGVQGGEERPPAGVRGNAPGFQSEVSLGR